MGTEVVGYVLGFVGTVVAAWLLYRGGGTQARNAKHAAEQTTHVDAQDSALRAWETLLEPYREEVAALRLEISEERATRAREARENEQRFHAMDERIQFLTLQVRHWKRLAKVIARWATTLRDQVLTLGGTVPATPDELLLIQSLDDDDL